MKPNDWKPRRFLKQSELRTRWLGVVLGSALKGEPGITHLQDDEGTHVVEYRSSDGYIRGVLSSYASGEVFMMTQPEWRGRGIGSQLLTKAGACGVPLPFEQQSYTRAGWHVVKRYLNSTSKPTDSCHGRD